jgi:hypothetical protein
MDLMSGSLERGSHQEVHILILHFITASGCIKNFLGGAHGVDVAGVLSSPQHSPHFALHSGGHDMTMVIEAPPLAS